MATSGRSVKQFVRSGAYQTTKALDGLTLAPPSDDGNSPSQKPTDKPVLRPVGRSRHQARIVLVGGDPRKPFKGIPAVERPFASVNNQEKLTNEINADQEVTAWLRNYGLSLPEDHLEAFLTYTNSDGVRLTIRFEDFNFDIMLEPNSSLEIHEVLKLDKLMGQLSDYMFVDEYNKNTILRLEADIRDKDATIAAREASIKAQNAELADLRSELAAFQLINTELEEANKNRARVLRGQTQPQEQTQGSGKKKRAGRK